MKNIVRIAAMLLVFIMAFMSLIGCDNNKEKIENLIAEFEYSCNTLEIEAILNCIAPVTADKIKLVLGLFGMITDKDTSEVMDDISALLIGDSSLDGNDFFSSVKIEIKNITVQDETAIVSSFVEYKINGETYSKMANFECVLYMEKWYIARFYFSDSKSSKENDDTN